MATQPHARRPPDIDRLRADLIGCRLPAATVRIEPYEAWLGRWAMCAPPVADGPLDPLWILVIALRGVGIAAMIDLGRPGPHDAVLFGGLDIEQHVPLRVGVDYQVDGSVTAVDRHTGRRIGLFDQVDFTVDILSEGGVLHGRAGNTFLFRRAT